MYPLCHTPTVTARAHPWGHKSPRKVKGSWVFKHLCLLKALLNLSESGPLSPAVASLFPVTTSDTLPVPSVPHTHLPKHWEYSGLCPKDNAPSRSFKHGVPLHAPTPQLGWRGQERQPRAAAAQITPKSCAKSLGKRVRAQALWPRTIGAEQGD